MDVALISVLGHVCSLFKILQLMCTQMRARARPAAHRPPFPSVCYLLSSTSWVECWGGLVSFWHRVKITGTADLRVCVCVCLFESETHWRRREEVRFLESELIRGSERFNYLTEPWRTNLVFLTATAEPQAGKGLRWQWRWWERRKSESHQMTHQDFTGWVTHCG